MQLSCSVYTYIDLPENTLLEFSKLTYLLPTFKVSRSERTGNVVSITAYDYVKNTDIPFDYSKYTQFDDNGAAKWYATGTILSDLAGQCGFSGYSANGLYISKLCYRDFAEKSCRQILEDLSKPEVGFWRASYGDVLELKVFSKTPVASIEDDDRSEISYLGEKTITSIYAEDELNGTEYPSSSSWQNTERFSGRYLDSGGVQKIYSILLGGGSYLYRGWSCSNILLSALYKVGDFLAIDYKALPVLSASYRFTAMGIVASMSAPAAENSFSEYQDAYSRAIAQNVHRERSYNGFFFGVNGLGIRPALAESVSRSSDSPAEYLYRADKTGAVTYDRYQLDGEMPVSIEKTGDTSRKINYGDASYLLSWDVDSSGKKTNITFTKEVS